MRGRLKRKEMAGGKVRRRFLASRLAKRELDNQSVMA